MKVGCIVLAHRAPAQLTALLEALRHPQLSPYLHVDRRVGFGPFAAALSGSGLEPRLLERRATPWGGAEVTDVVLDGLASALADGCGYVLLISGQDFPIRPVEAIVEFAERAEDRSYVAHWPLPTPRWRFGGRDRTDFYSYDVLGRRETCIPRGEDTSFLNWKGRAINQLLRLRTATKPPRRFPPYARPHGGWSWLNLSDAAARAILDFVDAHPDYRAYHRHTLSADEVFFQSILAGTDFAERHEVVDHSLRFTIWPERASHPRILTRADLPAMMSSDDLFARKFDSDVDAGILADLAERVAA